MVTRNEKGQVVKGSTALPGAGRPKQTDEQREALEILNAGTPDAARALVASLDTKDAVKAAEAILMRTLGKPEMADKDRAALKGTVYGSLTLAQLLELEKSSD